MSYSVRRSMLAMLLLGAGTSACSDGGPLAAGPGDEARAAAGAQETLLALAPGAPLTLEQRGRVEKARARPTSGEVHVARTAPAAEALLASGRPIVLQVGPGRALTAVARRTEVRGAANLSWGGPLQNEDGWVDLVLTEKGITGALRAGSESFSIQPVGGGLHAVVRVDRSRLPPDHPTEPAVGPVAAQQRQAPAPRRAEAGTLAVGGSMAQASAMQSSVSTYQDLLVAYTPAVANAWWDVTGLAQLAVDQTNQSYQNSQIGLGVRLKGVHLTSYSESGRTYEQHLSAARTMNDGYMDELNGVRNNTLSDAVMLLVDSPGYCGIAYLNATMQYAYGVVKYDCVAYNNYSFQHELGHVQGAQHDRISSSSAPYPYGHGYFAPNNAWRTIMAYPKPCGDCPRINYWSDPYTTYTDGQVMGTVDYENNARVLGNTKERIRDYRTLSHPLNVTHDNAGVANVAPKLSWSPVAGAESYQVWGCVVDNGSYYYESCFQPVGGNYSGTTYQNWYPSPSQTGSTSSSYNCPRIAMYRVRTYSIEGLSGYFQQIGVCVF